jgi:hypothetical protein
VRLKIDIAIGNEAMQTGQDVGDALSNLAASLIEHDDLLAAWPAGTNGPVMDANGNKVGAWQLTPAGED